MLIRISRPSLAALWRSLLPIFEAREVADAPAAARRVAIAAWTGRVAEAGGVTVERRGRDVVIRGAVAAPKVVRPRKPRRKALALAR